MVHKITALRMQKRNRSRVNVYLDGEFAFGLQHIVAAWLQVGQELSDEKIAQLRAEDTAEAAYQRALNFLDYRPRSEAEVRKNLKDHQIEDQIIEVVVKRLKRGNLLNDARFAQTWVENRSALRPRSRRALAYELKRKGVAEDALEKVLAEVDDESMAYQAALKRNRRYENLEWNDYRKKMTGFLAQRGFDYQVIKETVARVWEEGQNTEKHSEEATL